MKRQTIIATLTAIAALSLPSIASADPIAPTDDNAPATPAEAPTKPAAEMPDRVSLHVAPALFMPIGTMGDATQGGGGGFVGLDYRLSPQIVLAFRGGYVSTFEQSRSVDALTMKTSIDFAPILGGVKWFLIEPNEGLFLSAEAGPVFVTGYAHATGQVAGASIDLKKSESETDLGAAASLGYQTGRWDLRAGVLTLDVGNAGKSTGIMASAAIAFAQF